MASCGRQRRRYECSLWKFTHARWHQRLSPGEQRRPIPVYDTFSRNGSVCCWERCGGEQRQTGIGRRRDQGGSRQRCASVLDSEAISRSCFETPTANFPGARGQFKAAERGPLRRLCRQVRPITRRGYLCDERGALGSKQYVRPNQQRFSSVVFSLPFFLEKDRINLLSAHTHAMCSGGTAFVVDIDNISGSNWAANG